MNLLKVVWVLAQGIFLPLVLWLDALRDAGNYGLAIGVFILLEVVYIIDAFLFLKVFKGRK